MKNNKKDNVLSKIKKTGYGILDVFGFGTFVIAYAVYTGVSYILSKKDENQTPRFKHVAMKKGNSTDKRLFSVNNRLNNTSMVPFDLPTVIKKLKHKLTWTKD